jgi:hypothetical protein
MMTKILKPGRKKEQQEKIGITIPENQKTPLRCFILFCGMRFIKIQYDRSLRYVFIFLYSFLLIFAKFKCVVQTNPEI